MTLLRTSAETTVAQPSRWPRPTPRGPIGEALFAVFDGAPAQMALALAADTRQRVAGRGEEFLDDDDAQLALAAIYEVSLQGIEGVPDRYDDDPGVAAIRRELEAALDAALDAVTPAPRPVDDLEEELWRLTAPTPGHGFAHRMAAKADLAQFREVAIHRSLYQLREGDTHTLAVAALPAAPKRALLEVQWDEYGGADLDRMHSQLFASTLRELGLSDRHGHYVDAVPAPTLALLNVLSRFALHRDRVGALVGTLVAIETTSSLPSRNYAAGLRRLGLGRAATRFYDEHVEADAVHEQIVVRELATAVGALDAGYARDVLFGTAAYLAVEDHAFERVAACWDAGRSSLRSSGPTVEVRS